MSDFTNRINRVKTEAEKLNEPLKGGLPSEVR